MLKSHFSIIYYNSETISDRAESFGVLLYFYAEKGRYGMGKILIAILGVIAVAIEEMTKED